MEISMNFRRKNIIRRLYDWVLKWAQSPYGAPALFLLAFAESSFFPIPPDVLLIALAISIPSRSFRFALICALGSVLGGILGYFIGLEFYEIIGKKIIRFYGLSSEFAYVGNKYGENALLAIMVAGFTPIPYKVFTIAAGVFHKDVPLSTLIIASALSRTARFFLVGTLIYIWGDKIKDFIDKYFNLLTILFGVLLLTGFLVIKFLR